MNSTNSPQRRRERRGNTEDFSNISALSFTRDARVRLLAVTGAQRSKFLPGLPTVAEALPGYEFDSWLGLLAPAATPKAQAEQWRRTAQCYELEPETNEGRKELMPGPRRRSRTATVRSPPITCSNTRYR